MNAFVKFIGQIKLFSRKGKKFYFFIRQLTGSAPRNEELYKVAFTHKSSMVSIEHRRKNNERLEFLGDAILGSVVAEYVFSQFPDLDEGSLSKMRSQIVCRAQLNEIALKMGLARHILTRSNQRIEHTHIPGDVLEALIGAFYLDHGYERCRQFIRSRIIEAYINVGELNSNDTNYKSKLLEWGQHHGVKVEFECVETMKNQKKLYFYVKALVDGEVAGTGEGFSKKNAQQNAAKMAIERMNAGGTAD